MNKQKIYFPNLNGIRFIAAFLVIIHHIEQFKSLMFISPNYWGTIPFITIIGKLGVILFFVLSGFLITYLLLSEEHTFSTISIRKFYIRRILRIWPLYFFIVFLAFIVLPNIPALVLPNYGKNVVYSHLVGKLLLYTIFFPNLLLSLYGIVPYASHTWSIGTEEQYYLVWPVFIKYCKRYRIVFMVLIVIIYTLFSRFLTSHYGDLIPFHNLLNGFWISFNIDCMAIGAIYAVLLFSKNPYLKYILNNTLFYIIIVIVLLLMIKGVYIPYIHNEFYALLFGLIILNFAANNRIQISLENKAFNYLGNISYGIYMYHPIGIALSITLCKTLNLLTNWLVYPFSFLFTILLASISYRYFESYFLSFKHKFSNILSGNDTKQ